MEILAWLKQFRRAPSRVFLTHGKPVTVEMLQKRVKEALGWRCEVPTYLQSVEL